MLNKYQLKANKTNKKQLSTTHSTVIDGHWSVVLGPRCLKVDHSFVSPGSYLSVFKPWSK